MSSTIMNDAASGWKTLNVWRRWRASFHRARPSRLLVLLGVVAIMTFLGFAGVALWYLHTQALAGAERELANLSSTLSEQTARAFRGIDQIARAEQERLNEDSKWSADPRETHVRLGRSILGIPQVSGAFIVDSEGKVAHSAHSFPPPKLLTTDRSYFLAHRNSPAAGPYISEPGESRVLGDWNLWLSRRLENPRGKFAGVIVIGIWLRYFEELYHSIDLGIGATMTLYRDDGTLLASYPVDIAARGRTYSHVASFALTPTDPARSLLRNAPGPDGKSRFSILRRIGGFPLVIEGATSESAALAAWRKSAWIIGGGALFATMLLAVLMAMLIQQFRRREQDQEKLRQNETLLHEAQRIAHVGSWSYRRIGRRTDCSQETYRILGLDAAAASPGDISKAVHPDDRRLLLHGMSTAFRGGRVDVELRVVRGLRGTRWVQFRAEPTFDAHGKIDSLHGTVLDITERKRAEASRAQLANIVESAEDAITSLSLDGRILSWNRGAEHLYGYAATEVLGKSSGDLLPPDQQADIRRLLELVQSGQSIEHYETARRTKDGETIYIALTVSPILDEHDRIVAASMIARDITARKHAEEARQAADERLQRITANVPDVVFQFRRSAGGSFSFSFVSERIHDLYEERAADVLDNHMRLFSLVPRDHQRALAKSMLKSKRSGKPWSFETLIRSKSGKRKWVRGQASISFGSDGSTIWDGVLSDITLQKRAAIDILTINEKLEQRVAERTRQLEAINKELEAFSYSVSHDLRAPLRAVEGFSRLLQQKYGRDMDEMANDYMNRVQRASQRMNELVDDLLKLAQISRSEIKSETVDLSTVAQGIISELADTAPDRVVDIDIEAGIVVNGDSRLLRIMLENLLGNAWKFTQRVPHPRISFGTIAQDGNKALFVRDNGAGFEMGRAHKLFGAFQRLHRATDFEGTGIGLATVQRIISLHGGRVWAEAAVDQGATFYFTL